MLSNTIQFTYNPSFTGEGAIIKQGYCPKHPGISIVDYMFLGIAHGRKDCLLCKNEFLDNNIKIKEERFNNFVKSSSNIWAIFGLPGCGKSKLFNFLTGLDRKVSDSMTSVTTLEEMSNDVINPKESIILDKFRFCDSEGLGATDLRSEDLTAKKFLDTLKLLCDRLISGSSGIILCIELGTRLTPAHQTFLLFIMKTLGDVRIILCFTKYSLRFKGDDQQKRSLASKWVLENAFQHCVQPMNYLGFTQITTCIINIDDQIIDIEELITELRVSTVESKKIVEIRKENKIHKNGLISKEEAVLLDKVSNDIIQDALNSDWFKTSLLAMNLTVKTGVVLLLIAIAPISLPIALIWKSYNPNESCLNSTFTLLYDIVTLKWLFWFCRRQT